MIEKMRSGAVVIDLAVSQGGNCEGTKSNETIIRNGVKLIGAGELPSSVPNDASTLYAKNLTSLITPFIKDGVINFCLLYTSPSPRDATLSRMPSSA